MEDFKQMMDQFSKEKEDLINEYDEKIGARRDQDSQRELIANAVKALGTIGQAEIQRKAKTDAGIQNFKPVENIDTTSDLKEKRKMLLENLKGNMDDLKSSRISPYQQAQLDLSRDKMKQSKTLKEKELKAKEKKESTKTSKKSKLQEEKEKLTAKRYDELQSTIPNRKAQMEEARQLIKAIEDDELSTGPGSKLAGNIGSFFGTEESTLKQRLDSLAEKAARAALKANGEVRPTDADVEGMKRAMFNLGNTEEANVKKLQDFMQQQQTGIDEYGQMKQALEGGKGLEDFILKDTYKPLNEQKINEVKRKTKDGRTAIFNAETKEFLRYE